MFQRISSLLTIALLGAASGCIIIIKEEHVGEHGGGTTEPWPGDPGETGWVEPDPITECDDASYASVIVNLVDAAGLPLSGAMVSWSLGDGGPPSEAQCMDESCTSFVAGWEIAGELTIYAELHQDTEDPCCWLDAYTSTTVTVPMGEDGCHVDTQEITLTLDPTMSCADGQECG